MKNLEISAFNDIAIKELNDSTLYDKSYPKALAAFIKECMPPITIALQGEWGSGKTSMMNMVKKELENSNVEYMEFNAWLFSQFNLGDELPLILLTHLSEEIGSYNKVKDILAKVGVAAAHFVGKKAGGTEDFMNSFTPDAIKQLQGLKKDFKDAVEIKLYGKKLSESELIDNKKNGKEKKLLIFIDDIDRLLPSKAVELLESIKLFCETENCVFVLAADYDVILKGAKEKFGDDKGQAFFDKIIQVPFNMPIATSKFDEFMNELIKNIITEEYDDKKDGEVIKELYKDITKCCIGNNPRSIKRLLNSFVIHDNVAMSQGIYTYKKDIQNSYTRLLLYCLLCIEINNKTAYYFLINLYKDNEGELNDYIDELKKIIDNPDDNDFINSLELNDDETYNIQIIKIFHHVFDGLAKSLDGKDNSNINKIFNVSSAAVSIESGYRKKVPAEVEKFNEICNANLLIIKNEFNKNNPQQLRQRKGSSIQHRPNLFYEDENSKVSIIFCCVFDKNNTDSVKIVILYWGEKLKEKNPSLYDKIVNLKLSENQNPTTTGTQYLDIMTIKFNEFSKLSEYIKNNFKKLVSVFEK